MTIRVNCAMFLMIVSLFVSCKKRSNNTQQNFSNSAVIKDLKSDRVVSLTDSLQFQQPVFLNIWLTYRILVSVDNFRNVPVRATITEYAKDSVKVFRSYYQDFFTYCHTWPQYDSMYYDQKIFNDTIPPCTKEKNYSMSLKKYHLLREKDVTYQQLLKETNDIKALEKLVNSLTVFHNFKFENPIQTNALQKFYMFFIIQLSENLMKYDNYKELRNTLYFKNVFPIHVKKELAVFEEQLMIVDSDSCHLLTNSWKNANRKYLRQMLPYLRRDCEKDNITYFYTMPDMKLFRLEVNLKNNKLELKSSYLNPQYQWLFL